MEPERKYYLDKEQGRTPITEQNVTRDSKSSTPQELHGKYTPPASNKDVVFTTPELEVSRFKLKIDVYKTELCRHLSWLLMFPRWQVHNPLKRRPRSRAVHMCYLHPRSLLAKFPSRRLLAAKLWI